MKQEDELISTMNRSIQQIINIFKLFKANPPDLNKAKNLVDYARLIESLLVQMSELIPKVCVPKSLFLKMEKESLEIGQIAENYMKEHRKSLVEIKVLEDKLIEAEQRERDLILEKEQIIKRNHHYKKKANLLKKNGQESIKNMLKANSKNQSSGNQRHSLPHLDKKEKLTLLYLMGPSNHNHNERLVHHLMTKR